MPVVFITGGAKRIGRGLATRFGERGWSVGIIYHTSSAAAHTLVTELKAQGLPAAAAQADVSDPLMLHAAMDKLTAEIGIPDVVVSNAGVFPPQRSIDDITLENIRTTVSINTEPLVTIAKWLREHSVNTKTSHRLIALSSLGAFEIWKDRIDYNMSKAALVNLVHSLSRAVAPSISVNSVAPGAIVVEHEPSMSDAELVRMERIPMGRYGTPDDIFDAVWFFATATMYITGQVLVVDGGYHFVR